MFELIIKAIIQGIIEGLTEFLPVSSTGHLILANQFFGIEGEFGNLFAIVIQSGAILAVILYFRDRFLPKSVSKEDMRDYVVFWSKIAVAILPAGILGILFEDAIDQYLFNAFTVAYALIIGAIILFVVERRERDIKVTSDVGITYKAAFLVGVAQCMALVPGMSRSASTIIGGLLLGFSRAVAAEMSFFMAVPTLLGAGIVKMAKAGFALTSEQWIVTGVGTFVSFVVAYLVIAVFMNFIKKHDFKVFAYYRVILGVVVLMFMS